MLMHGSNRLLRSVKSALLLATLLAIPLVVGQCGSSSPANTSATIDIAASGRSPQDSALDSAANLIYFVGSDSRGPGLYRVASTGGAVTDLLVGAPLVQPQSLALSSDDKTIYIADTKGGGNGAVYAVNAISGQLVGTFASNTHPRGIDVGPLAGTDELFFTGLNTADNMPGLFQMRPDGSALTVLAKGAPFSDPSGVVVTQSGTAYVTDTAGVNGMGHVIQVANGTASEFMTNLWLGKPAGIAISLDETTLVVSAINPASATDEVLLINIATQSVTPVTQDIGQNTAAGGVHRSRNSNVFAWADLSAGATGGGLVYRITLK